jgi:glycosyltransferase involved in cell wall biosynthesis
MIVYYFGADAPWENQRESDINRRNMAVLLAIAEQANVKLVYNVIRCTRALLLNKKNQKKSFHSKIENIYIGAILPERGLFKVFFRPLNKLFLIMLNHKVVSSEDTVSWCYWPKGYEDYKFLGIDNRMIFDTDHNIIDDPNLPEDKKGVRSQLLLEAGNKAELILSSSRSMISWFKEKGIGNTNIMMNGVFSSRVNLTKTDKLDDNFQVTYCGTLSKWVKVDWIINMAKYQPDWIINIIGKNYKTEIADQLLPITNIILHGFLKPNKVDDILKKTDVCIGLYIEEAGLDVNSMKLYDYLAQGLPVVVNRYHSNLIEDFDGLIDVVHGFNDFITTIKTTKTKDLESLQSFLTKVTWKNRVKPIIQFIDAH